MEKTTGIKFRKRLLSLMLALALGITFIPLLSDYAYADDTDQEAAAVTVEIPDADAEANDAAVAVEIPDANPANAVALDAAAEDVNALDAADAIEDDTAAAEVAGVPAGGNAVHVDVPAFYETAGGELHANAESAYIDPSYYNVSITQSKNTVTVKGTINDPYSFVGLFIDSADIKVLEFLGNSVDHSFNIGDYCDTGYHTVFLGVVNIETQQIADIVGQTYMTCNKITNKPTYKGVFEVYSKNFKYSPYGTFQNTNGKLYMEYKTKNAKKWKTKGPMTYNMVTTAYDQTYMVKGLKAKTIYNTRIRYGEEVKYEYKCGGDDKTYFFGGPVFGTGNIKTGAAKKPAVKSITCKAVKVKYHKVRHPAGYYWSGNVLLKQNAWTEKYYSYNVKVTVKLKSKPGTNGIFVNGRYLKGNKKTYTTTFVPAYGGYSSKRPKGHVKWTVQLRSGQSKTYGGYSPIYKKTMKLK